MPKIVTTKDILLQLADSMLKARPISLTLGQELLTIAEHLGRDNQYLKQSTALFHRAACRPWCQLETEQRALTGFVKHVNLMQNPEDRVKTFRHALTDTLSTPALRLESVLGIIRDVPRMMAKSDLRGLALETAMNNVAINSAHWIQLKSLRFPEPIRPPRPESPHRTGPQRRYPQPTNA